MKTLKKLFRIQAALFLMIFVLSSCSSGNSNGFSKMITIDSQDLNTLVKLKDTKLKNHDKVQQILSDLPGNVTIKKFSVSDETINVSYGLSKSSDIKQSDFNSYWIDNNNYKKIFANNATALLALIPDLRYVNFTLDSPDNNYAFSITRGQLEPLYGMDIKNLSKDASRWKSYAIDKVIKSDSEMTKLYSVYAVKQAK